MFVDKVDIYIKAGDGGNGAVAFHREKYVSHGGPDGGDGGNGGNIIFKVASGENTLLAFKYRRKFIAENGANGAGSKFHGKNGKDLVITVPPGTLICDKKTGKVIFDMGHDREFVAAKGGKGGWGNTHFATPTRQIPRFAKSGIPGEERELTLELKMLADVGLVGFPNVGKSTLLSRISAARPKIANYHFTTLSPMLGVVSLGGEGAGFVVADIPGLIEGASEGLGLGHDFLRHVDRCRLLLHLVDASASDGRDPLDDIKKINFELAKYSENLSKRPQIIVLNKLDLDADEEKVNEIKEYAEKLEYDVAEISAATGEGIDGLIKKTAALLSTLPAMTEYECEYVEEIEEISREITVRRENDIYIVEGEWLLRLMNNINFDDRESLSYFQRTLKNSGIIDKLVEAGVKDGDTVSMYGFEFEFVK